MKKLLLWSIAILCLSQIGLAATENTIIPPIYLRNNVVDSIYLPDIIHDDDYDDYSVKAHSHLEMRYNYMSRMIYVTPKIEETGLTAITIQKGDSKSFDIPVIIKRTIRHTFVILPKSDNSKAFLAGTFNNWSPTSLPMLLNQNGIPVMSLYLEPGRYFFKYLLDGEITVDANTTVVSDGQGGEMNMINIPPTTSNISLELIKTTTNSDETIDLTFMARGLSELQLDNIVIFKNNSLLNPTNYKIEKNQFTFAVPIQEDHTHTDIIRLGVNSTIGGSTLHTLMIQEGKVNYTTIVNSSHKSLTIYSILVDRFNDGSSLNNETKTQDSIIPYARYKGGDFAGITKKIKDGYFTDLNITTLLLSPVVDNPDTPLPMAVTAPSKSSSFLGLWPNHPRKIENHFGSMDELRLLIEEAHNRGISVILDYVADQVHKDHPYTSAHPHWFLPYRGGDSFVRVFDFNSHPQAIDTVTENIIWWLEQTNADGLKIDNAGTINEEFRRNVSKKIHRLEEKSEKKFIIIGHVRDIPYLTPTIISQGQMNSVLNSFMYESINAISTGKESFNNLSPLITTDKLCDFCLNYIDENTGYFHPIIPDKRTLNFIALPTQRQTDSMNAIKNRFISLPLYHVITHTLPGIPIIHTGEEMGYSASISSTHNGTLYFDDKQFQEEKDVLATVKKITQIRAKYTALQSGTFISLYTLGDFMAYIRADNSHRILIALNNSDNKVLMSCEIPSQYQAKKIVDIFDSKSEDGIVPIYNNSSVKFNVPSKGFRIYLIE